ncbi:transcription antitermination factor NusB [Candidatus Saganbacteria bacterium]|nr:transcription antitermination factor NusB [Candidatus Saganbacteria bacterium]
MGKRSTARRLAMQALYQAELAKVDVAAALDNLAENEKFIPETLSFASSLAEKAWAAREKSDREIVKLSTDWPLERIGKVDHSILRLALWEIDQQETPKSVVINEAVELAKKYSGEESAKFINGILGAYVR